MAFRTCVLLASFALLACGAGGARAADGEAALSDPVPVDREIVVPVAAAADDYKEKSDGTMNRGDREHDLWTAADLKQAYRFINLPLPQGVRILEARLEGFAAGSTYVARPLRGQARGEAADNAPAYRGTRREITNAPKTAAAATVASLPAWKPNAYNTVADVTAIVSEIVNRPGWRPNNALKLFLLPESTSFFRRIKTRDAGATRAPRLYVRWVDLLAPPQVRLGGPTVIKENETVSFSACFSSREEYDRIVNYSFDFGDGSPPVNTAEFSAFHAFAASGEYTVRLTVLDLNGLIGTAALTVTVGGPVLPPELPYGVYGPDTGLVGERQIFNAIVHNLDGGTTVNWHWETSDGLVQDGPVGHIQHAFAAPGSYTVSVVVTDDDGLTASAEKTIVILDNRRPVGVLSAPLTAVVGQPVVFDASGSYDPDGQVVSYRFWTANFYTITPSARYTHTFTAPGTYRWGLTVTDDDGWCGLNGAQVTIVVSAP